MTNNNDCPSICVTMGLMTLLICIPLQIGNVRRLECLTTDAAITGVKTPESYCPNIGTTNDIIVYYSFTACDPLDGQEKVYSSFNHTRTCLSNSSIEFKYMLWSMLEEPVVEYRKRDPGTSGLGELVDEERCYSPEDLRTRRALLITCAALTSLCCYTTIMNDLHAHRRRVAQEEERRQSRRVPAPAPAAPPEQRDDGPLLEMVPPLQDTVPSQPGMAG